MAALSRRELLLRLAAAYGGVILGGCNRSRDRFASERVCIHVLHPKDFILQRMDPVARRDSRTEYFNIGFPELFVCETRGRLLDAFQYFWPFSRSDFETLERSITIQYQTATIDVAHQVSEFALFLRKNKARAANAGASTAVMFTFNEATQPWSATIADACRESGVEELVVFKDPTKPPYLCDYPAKQKGFKRPPP